MTPELAAHRCASQESAFALGKDGRYKGGRGWQESGMEVFGGILNREYREEMKVLKAVFVPLTI